MRSATLALAVVLAGCGAQPTMVASGPRSVTVESRGPYNDGEAQNMAEAPCQGQGLHAQANQKDPRQRITYDCVP